MSVNDFKQYKVIFVSQNGQSLKCDGDIIPAIAAALYNYFCEEQRECEIGLQCGNRRNARKEVWVPRLIRYIVSSGKELNAQLSKKRGRTVSVDTAKLCDLLFNEFAAYTGSRNYLNIHIIFAPWDAEKLQSVCEGLFYED